MTHAAARLDRLIQINNQLCQMRAEIETITEALKVEVRAARDQVLEDEANETASRRDVVPVA